MTSPWQTARAVDPGALTPTRLVVHHAVQPLAALAHTVIPARDDDSHTALHWSGDVLWTGVLPGGGRAGFRVEDFSLVVQGADGETRGNLDATGETRASLEAFLSEACGAPALVHPGYALPAHPTWDGAPFDPPDQTHLAVLGAWFAGAATALHQVAHAEEPAPAVRCWPHHFDLATLIVLEGEGESMKSVGVGLSPGDGGIGQPYWYVNAWPAPEAPSDLPALPAGGRWNLQGWFGAVLEGSALLGQDDPASALADWLALAVPTCKELALAAPGALG